MHTNVRRFLEERNVIKANPILATLRTVCFVWSFTAACLVALVVVAFVIDTIFGSGQHFSKSPILSPFLPVLVISALNLAINITQVRYWEGIEQRRFAAVQGDRTLLAAEQPTPYAALMRLPPTITLGYHKEFLLWMTGAAVLMALFFAGAFTFFNNGSLLFTSNRLLFFLVSFSILVVLILAFLFVVLFLGRQQVEVTEHGLTARYAGRTSTVMWEEARLFALYGTFGAQKSGAAITYELSSARDIVRWTWVQRKTYFSGLKPTLPLDEYNRQMQVLLSLVEAKTGLALYDLR